MSIIQTIIGTNLTISSGGGSGGPPSYYAYGWSNPMNEGEWNTIYLDYANIPNNTEIFWAVDNFASASDADWLGGVAPSGSFFISGTGNTSFSFQAVADMITEGNEGYVVRIGTIPGGTDILNQYMTISDTSTPVGDFTIEWFQKSTSYGGNPRPWSVGFYPTQKISISYEGNVGDYFWINDTYIMNTSQTHVGQGWQHMAYVRKNGVVKGYVNGVQYTSSVSNSSLITATDVPFYVGSGELAAGMFVGFVTNLHVIKGVAKYDGNFAIPTLPIASTANTKLLLKAMDDSTKFVDETGKSVIPVNSPIWSSDSPFAPLGPYSQYANSWGYNNGTGNIDFNGGNYNPDLINVQPGWAVTNGSVSGTVLEVVNDVGFTRIYVNFDPVTSNTWTFTQPALGGSLYFNGTNYLNYGPSTDWAMDV